MALNPGDPAPSLSIRNQSGKTVKLSDYSGKYVLLYFYPKDNTPGCTIEAKSLRDHYAEFTKLNAVILGVSKQDETSHKEFISQHQLPFDLLVDSDGTLAKSVGVDSIPVVGLLKRQSVLIDPAGRIAKIYRDVDAGKHAEEVLADIQKVQKQPKQK
ncbi:MAG: peroxiredoxin [Bdellovibrio sp.]|nr:MAG: peroxiredoxin [Bdellovibrio sp.]